MSMSLACCTCTVPPVHAVAHTASKYTLRAKQPHLIRLVCRDMSKAMQFKMFRYTKYYHRMAGNELVMDLLNDSSAQDVLQVCCQTRAVPAEQHARVHT
jgi:hypothetical protein